MITDEEKNTLLDNLRQMPIVELACKKTGIGRSTFYRHKKEDKEFSRAVEEAIQEGESLISDLSESQLISLIRDGNFQAIQLWLKHHHKKYSEKLEITANVNIKVCFYILPEIVNEHLSLPEAVDRLSIICKSLKSEIAFENTLLEIAISKDPKLEKLNIEFLKLKSRDKRTRLAALSNSFYAGQILFPEKGSKSDKLIEQIIGFGREKHDDLVDAFTCAARIALEKKYATDLRTIAI